MEELTRCSKSSGVLYDSTQYIERRDSQRDRGVNSNVEVRVLLGGRESDLLCDERDIGRMGCAGVVEVRETVVENVLVLCM